MEEQNETIWLKNDQHGLVEHCGREYVISLQTGHVYGRCTAAWRDRNTPGMEDKTGYSIKPTDSKITLAVIQKAAMGDYKRPEDVFFTEPIDFEGKNIDPLDFEGFFTE